MLTTGVKMIHSKPVYAEATTHHTEHPTLTMRPRPAKDEDVRPEDPEQVGGVRNGVNTGPPTPPI